MGSVCRTLDMQLHLQSTERPSTMHPDGLPMASTTPCWSHHCCACLQISGHPVIAPHLNKLYGIRNGIDADLWDPADDVLLPSHYSPENVTEVRMLARVHSQGWACEDWGVGMEGGYAPGAEPESPARPGQASCSAACPHPPHTCCEAHKLVHFTSHPTQGKAAAKRALRRKLELAEVDVPVVGCVTRLVAQKVGFPKCVTRCGA